MAHHMNAGGRQSATEMADLSEAESDTSSIMGETSSNDPAALKPPSPATREQLAKRMESLIQKNRVLAAELEASRYHMKILQEENRTLKKTSLLIHTKAEQEEEFISNTLLKKIQELKKEKEALALNYEQEEECLTNDLSRKLNQLRQEKAELASTLQQEQESMVGKLMRKIKRLEADTVAKQQHLEQLRREKVELENTLEQEQEALVNRLWKRMDKLESEKQYLQQKLEQPMSAPPSPMDISGGVATHSSGAPVLAHGSNSGTSGAFTKHIPNSSNANSNTSSSAASGERRLRNEVARLKEQLQIAQQEYVEKMNQFSREEQHIRDENIRLQRRLQLEVDRRMQLCRHLSESESSLEMDEERYFNELSQMSNNASSGVASGVAGVVGRSRTISSPISCIVAPRSASPALTAALNVSVTSPAIMAYGSCPSPLSHRCPSCGHTLQPTHCNQLQSLLPAPSPPPSLYVAGSPATPSASMGIRPKPQQATGVAGAGGSGEKFLKPANPPTGFASASATTPSGGPSRPPGASTSVITSSATNHQQSQVSSSSGSTSSIGQSNSGDASPKNANAEKGSK